VQRARNFTLISFPPLSSFATLVSLSVLSFHFSEWAEFV